MDFQNQTATIRNVFLFFALSTLLALFTACSSSNNTTATPDPTPAPVTDEVTVTPTLSGAERVPPIAGNGSGVSSFTVDKLSGAISGSVTASNLSAPITVAHIHTGEAGIEGGVALALEAGSDANTFIVPAGSVLDNEQLADFLAGNLYVNVHTSTNPSGEIRGQLLPAGITVVRAELGGFQEVPPVESDASAIGYITLNTSTRAFSGNLRTTGLDDATAAHIHNEFAGLDGGVIAGLEQDSSDLALWQFPAGVEFTEDQLGRFNAGATYFNIHTPANPGGEVRGQLVPDGIFVTGTDLDGFEETTPVDTTASAFAAITVDLNSGAAVAIIHTTNLETATAAHIHSGFAGTDGGVLIGLEQDAADASIWRFPADASFTAEQIAQLQAGGTYFNVHTPANPAGEVRGQLGGENISFTITTMDGGQEVPPVATAGSGIGYATVNEATGSIIAFIRTAGLMDTATAAHIHLAAEGSNGPVVIALEQDATDSSIWNTPDGAILDSDSLAAFLNEELYFNVHTPANPAGDIRGQL